MAPIPKFHRGPVARAGGSPFAQAGRSAGQGFRPPHSAGPMAQPGPRLSGVRRATMSDSDKVRLDSWLWAARFFKTRSLAAQAVDGGRVNLNGDKAKRSKAIKVGDEIRVRIGPYHHQVVVRGLSDRRGPASAAALLYLEDPESKAARELLAERLKMQ